MRAEMVVTPSPSHAPFASGSLRADVLHPPDRNVDRAIHHDRLPTILIRDPNQYWMTNFPYIPTSHRRSGVHP
jgi:hypothetical protein